MRARSKSRNVTELAPVAFSDLDSPSLEYFHSALSHKAWYRALDWSEKSNLSARRQELACRIASQSSHAEQIGMLTAAALLLQASDPVTRLALATAVRDESVHVHAFSTYAAARGGRVDAPVKAHDAIEDWLLGVEMGFLDRLLMHTLAEGFATDQFYYLSLAFQDDLLGKIYKGVLSDESRHVRLGMEAVACHLSTEKVTINFEAAGERALRLSGTNDEMFAGVAEIAGTSMGRVRERYLRRLSQRLQKMAELVQIRRNLRMTMTTAMTSETGFPPVEILAYQTPIRGQVDKRATKKGAAKKGTAKKGAAKKGAGKKGGSKSKK
jgi:hypothetical protein